jgi:hypothetical protein
MGEGRVFFGISKNMQFIFAKLIYVKYICMYSFVFDLIKINSEILNSPSSSFIWSCVCALAYYPLMYEIAYTQ